MNRNKRILLSMGTRPEIIKMLPLYHQFKQEGYQPILLHTGQHSDMADVLYQLFEITPDYRLYFSRTFEKLEINPKCELAALTSALLLYASNIISEIDPSLVLVHGDTSSALAVAMAAFYQQRSIAHIEAGLRSHNQYSPFPEEMNRVLIGRLAHWHFAPTIGARENLIKEGLKPDTIHVVGNSIVDATTMGATRINRYLHSSESEMAMGESQNALLHSLEHNITNKRLVLVTAHRRENQAQLHSIANAVIEALKQYEDLIIVWPVHPNPRIKEVVHSYVKDLPPHLAERLHLTEPLPYPIILWILKNAWLILTDSGGLQEEAITLNVPVLVLRDTTERPEIIEAGGGRIVGTDYQAIIDNVSELYTNPLLHKKMSECVNPFGDGRTSEHICDILRKEFFEK